MKNKKHIIRFSTVTGLLGLLIAGLFLRPDLIVPFILACFTTAVAGAMLAMLWEATR